MRTLLTTIAILALESTMLAAPQFQSAKPVWPAGREREKNLFVGFRADASTTMPAAKVVLRVAGSTAFRCYVNGEFAGHGPARSGHGYFRVDERDLGSNWHQGKNTVAIEVAGYNVNSYQYVDEPSFLQAEIVADGEVIAATGHATSPFQATILPQRVQKVQRLSFQRPFSEFYRLAPETDDWRAPKGKVQPTALDVLPPVKLLPRRVPFPKLDKTATVAAVASGRLKYAPPKDYWADRSLVGVGTKIGGYLQSELEVCASRELQNWSIESRTEKDGRGPHNTDIRRVLEQGAYHIEDFGRNVTGFVGASFECTAPTRVFLSFDELLRDSDVDFLRLGMVNAIGIDLQPGKYEFESFEPYTLRYIKVSCVSGACSAWKLHVREYANDDTGETQFKSSNPDLDRVFEAARQTFRQNAPDVFMDCPSRERAGWLCDSFFTARTAKTLCSDCSVEQNFLENFALTEKFDHLPEGMLPMCYPGDHPDGVFIPNWAMWCVIELEEYLARTGDRELVDAFEPKVMALIKYFEPLRNSDGLLEKLPGWVFVEWSDANKFLQDVSYASNMVYAGMLSSAGRMYGKPELIATADKVRQVIRDQSFNGSFFIDNAVRKDGKLERTNNSSEVCQYFAFFFDVATTSTHAELWKRLVDDFGTTRSADKVFPEVRKANAFIGNALRLELLGRAGLVDQMAREQTTYFLPMAERTGTLWENDTPVASCNHGFASHAAHLLMRDVLGIRDVDTKTRTVRIRIPDLSLESCEGRVHAGDGFASLKWWHEGGKVKHKVSVPDGYKVVME